MRGKKVENMKAISLIVNAVHLICEGTYECEGMEG
jgi:hypothetical protein